MNTLLKHLITDRPFLICAHRGQWGGNIAQNTVEAAQVTALHGAEILELDVEKSLDGHYFCFHTHAEAQVIGTELDLRQLTWAEIQSFPLINSLGAKIDSRMESLTHLLENAPEQLIFQVDRCFTYLDKLLPLLNELKPAIKERIMIKIPLDTKALETIVNFPYPFMAMVIIDSDADLATIANYPTLNLVGLEVLATSPADSSYGPAFIDRIHQMGLLVQINALKLNDQRDLYAGYDDNRSLLEGPEAGWGKLVNYGVDIIQTDWVLALDHYRQQL